MRLDAGCVLLLLSVAVNCAMAPRHRRQDDGKTRLEMDPMGPFFPSGPNGLCPSQCVAELDVLLCHHSDGLSMVQLARCVKYSKHNFAVVELRSTTDICSCFLLDFIRLTTEKKIITFTPTSCSTILLKMCYPLLPERVRDLEFRGIVAGLVLEQKDSGWRKAVHRHLAWLWFKVTAIQSLASRIRYRSMVTKMVKSVFWSKEKGLEVSGDRIVPFMLYKNGHIGPLYGRGRRGWYSFQDFKPVEAAQAGSSWVEMRTYKDFLKYEIESKKQEKAELYEVVEPSTVNPFQGAMNHDNATVIFHRYVYGDKMRPNKKRLGIILFILGFVIFIACTAFAIQIYRDRQKLGSETLKSKKRKKDRGFMETMFGSWDGVESDGSTALADHASRRATPNAEADLERRLSKPYSHWSAEDFEKAREHELKTGKSKEKMQTERADADAFPGPFSDLPTVDGRDVHQKMPEQREARYQAFTGGRPCSAVSKSMQGAGIGKGEMWTQVNIFDIVDEVRKKGKSPRMMAQDRPSRASSKKDIKEDKSKDSVKGSKSDSKKEEVHTVEPVPDTDSTAISDKSSPISQNTAADTQMTENSPVTSIVSSTEGSLVGGGEKKKKKKKKKKGEGKMSRRLDRSQSASTSSTTRSASTNRTYTIHKRQEARVAFSDFTQLSPPLLDGFLRPSSSNRPSRPTKRYRSAEDILPKHVRLGAAEYSNDKTTLSSVASTDDKKDLASQDLRTGSDDSSYRKKTFGDRFVKTEQSEEKCEAVAEVSSVPPSFGSKDAIHKGLELPPVTESRKHISKRQAETEAVRPMLRSSDGAGPSAGPRKHICLGLHSDSESFHELKLSGKAARGGKDFKYKTGRAKSAVPNITYQLAPRSTKITPFPLSGHRKKGRKVCLGYCKTTDTADCPREPTPVRRVCLGLHHTEHGVAGAVTKDKTNNSRSLLSQTSDSQNKPREKSLPKSAPVKILGKCHDPQSRSKKVLAPVHLHQGAQSPDADTTGDNKHTSENDNVQSSQRGSHNRSSQDGGRTSKLQSTDTDSTTLQPGSKAQVGDFDNEANVEANNFNEGACSRRKVSPRKDNKRERARKRPGHVPVEPAPSTSKGNPQESPLIRLDNNGSDTEFASKLSVGSLSLFPSASELESFALRMDRDSPMPFSELLSQFQKMQDLGAEQREGAADSKCSHVVTPQTSGNTVTYTSTPQQCPSSMSDQASGASTNSQTSQYSLGPRTPFSPPQLSESTTPSSQDTQATDERAADGSAKSASVKMPSSDSSSRSSLVVHESRSSASIDVDAVAPVRINRKRTRSDIRDSKSLFSSR